MQQGNEDRIEQHARTGEPPVANMNDCKRSFGRDDRQQTIGLLD